MLSSTSWQLGVGGEGCRCSTTRWHTCRGFQSVVCWFLARFPCCLQYTATAAQLCSASLEGRKGLGCEPDLNHRIFPQNQRLPPLCAASAEEGGVTRLLCLSVLGFQEPVREAAVLQVVLLG